MQNIMSSRWAVEPPNPAQTTSSLYYAVYEDVSELEDHGSWKENATDAASQEPYQYDQLTENSDEVRMLQLQPGDFNDEIRCTLFKAKMRDRPQYEAISYVWGDPSIKEPISCSGQRLDITVNLADALRHLRHQTKRRTLWADAININQQDIKERGHQVALMAGIYTHARRVIVWLGLDSNESAGQAFNLIYGYTAFVDGEINRLQAISKNFHIRDICAFHPDGPSPVIDSDLDSLADIFNRAWFSRLWVLQEVGLAAHATALCGCNEIEFERLICFVWVVGVTSLKLIERLNLLPIQEAFHRVWCTFDAEATWVDRIPFALPGVRGSCRINHVLGASCKRNASDRRDFFYAMLGHPTFKDDSGVTLIEPDYTLSFEQVRHNLVTSVIAKKGDLSILSRKQGHSRDKPDTNASWIPSFDQEVGDVLDGPMYVACRDLRSDVEILGNELRCKGIYIDVVASCSGTLLSPETNTKATRESRVASMARSIWDQVQKPEVTTQYGVGNSLQSLACILSCLPLAIPEKFPSIEAREEEVSRRSRALDHYLFQTTSTEKQFEARNDSSAARANSQRAITADNGRFLFYTWGLCQERQFFRTDTGYWGLGSMVMERGDVCSVLYGSRVPYILRPYGKEGKYKLIGECYMLGLMEGQALDRLAVGESEEYWFSLC